MEDNKTYYCDECEMVIRDEDVSKSYEESEAWGHSVYEEWWVCPVCGESVRPFYGEPELEVVYNNPYRDITNLMLGRCEDDEY